ncbi:hypothetical protein SPRG_02768 [Saprolegnia parasitica CBS 223.65]|uniref:Cystatin domain-containing protein n=1 Tax=Saprolegnia parasitica (strain CBS 223.65) TaxID=695850 RepID=A0A067CNN3_SAPPC|nr:hypothetical protein SPRG_02768 [Saprolegnia parasitica CBS 223.65]KDO32289.1 hypothetical protein SPRG_02768 [Saprolegnia parasitica CBS 223.65]|eukprot:XP_012196745.1 hypothetical protein SPRG_02768 [Saprolegnia parasitica CBS 223.65]
MVALRMLLPAMAVASAGAATHGLVGGWSQTSIEDAKPALYGAFQNASSAFVCVTGISSVQKQVVAGINYKFHVVGCPVNNKAKTLESCPATFCPPTDKDQINYEIDVFAPLSSNAFELKAVAMEDAPPEVLVGGWKEGDIDDAADDLYNGLSQETSYKNHNTAHVCVTSIEHVHQQVVSGMNYRFDVLGCQVPNAVAATRGCSCASSSAFKIGLYAQSWTHTYEVLSVESAAPLAGSWKHAEMNSEAKDDFYNALTNDTSHAHVCVSSFLSVASQVVAGTQYRFNVEGCASYLISIYVQPWTRTYEVIHVYEESQLLQLVTQWISANDRNQFGDAKDTSYLGGTPLMNELTGESMTLLEYVTQQHPDLPWLADKQVVSLRLNHAAISSVDAAAKPLAVIGLVVSCILVVSLVVLHKHSRQRTKTYEQLQTEH